MMRLAVYLIALLAFNIKNANADTIQYKNLDGYKLIGQNILYQFVAESNVSFLNQRNHLDKDYIKSQKNVLNLGFTKSDIWLKFTINNQTSYNKLFIEIAKPSLDFVLLLDQNGPLDSISDITPYSERSVEDPHPVFEITISAGSTKTFYLLVKSKEEIILPIYLGSYETITNQSKRREMLFGAFIGLMSVMILYNFFLFISLRSRIYLIYVANILTLVVGQSSVVGYANKYFWPNVSIWPNYSVIVMPLLSIIVGMWFVYEFLDLKSNMKKAIYPFTAIVALCFIGILLTFTGEIMQATILLRVLGSSAALLVIVLSLILVNRGLRSAKYLLFAWAFFLLGVILYVLKDANILTYNFITNYSMPIGSALETVLLSFALADRINTLKKEREESQKQMLEEMQKNQDLTRNLNIELEKQVAERTQTLEITNNDLNLTLANLKATQSQLVDAEKMASLGHLTAGIAHEINNPINFVSSNVEPLRNDLKDVLHILNQYHIYASESDDPAVKNILVEAEKLDIDFSIEEINQLINGIEEGARRTSEIVTGLKNFSRTDEEDLKKSNINEGLKSTITILKSQLRNIKLKINYGEIPPINCQLGKLNQVFMNIIDNSIDAIHDRWKNSPGGVLTIRTDFQEGNIVVTIGDNGQGISDEDKKHIFDPFFTTKDVGKGTGLGLSISYGIIEKHNGQINVVGVPGEGSTFSIMIPEKPK